MSVEQEAIHGLLTGSNVDVDTDCVTVVGIVVVVLITSVVFDCSVVDVAAGNVAIVSQSMLISFIKFVVDDDEEDVSASVTVAVELIVVVDEANVDDVVEVAIPSPDESSSVVIHMNHESLFNCRASPVSWRRCFFAEDDDAAEGKASKNAMADDFMMR